MSKRGVPGRDSPFPGALFFCFLNRRTKPCPRFCTHFSCHPLPSRIETLCKRNCRDYPHNQAHFWPRNTAHADTRTEALRPPARGAHPSPRLPLTLPPAPYRLSRRRLQDLGWDSDFSRLFAPWFVAQPPLTRALSPLLLPSSEVLFSVGHRQNIPIIRFQRKECPPYLNHKTIKPRRLASSAAVLFGPIQNPAQGDKQRIKVAFPGPRNVPLPLPSQVEQLFRVL